MIGGCMRAAADDRLAYLILSPDGRSDDQLVDIVELIPVLIPGVHISEQRLKFGPSRYTHVQRLCCYEAGCVKQVEIVLICKV